MDRPPPAAAAQASWQLDAMRRVALTVAGASGPGLFDALVAEAARALPAAAAMIAVFADDRQTVLRVLAMHENGQARPGFEYPLAGSPCQRVVGHGYLYRATGVGAEVDPRSPFALAGFDAYAAFPLNDDQGRPLGVLAALDREPIALGDAEHAEAVLKVVAVRAAAEIERTRALEALRRSEASYRTIFDSAESAIYVHDWDSFALIDVNPRACEDHGRTRAEMLSADPSELMGGEPPYDLPRAIEKLELARLGRCPPFEWQVRLKDGRLRWWEIHLKPAQLDGRRCILAFTHDVTARKGTEQQLRASEEQHRTIFNGSVDGMLVKDAANLVVDVNDAYLHMHGFAREELIGRCLLDFLPPALQAHCGQVLPAVLAGTPCHFETTTWRKDRSPLDVEIHGVPVVYGGQTRALVIMRDITGRKADEARLRRSEAQYRAIFDASADALMLWNSQLVRVDVNSAHERIFGFPREAVVGRAFEGLPYPDELARPRLEMVRRALAGEASRAELEAVRHDGTRILTELRTIPFVHRGEPHALQIARDITERKAAEERLRNGEQQYRAIFDGSADSMGLWNEDLVLVDVNHAFTRLAGWTREDVIGRRLDERPGEPEIAQRVELIRGALAGREGRIETTVPSKDGPAYEVEIRYVPVSFGGRAYALSVARDITERNAALGALRAQEEQYRGIFNASADALVLRDADFRIVDVNSTYERMSGWTRDDVLGVDRVIANPPDVAPAIRALHARALGGEPIEIEVPLVRRDGQRYELDLRGVAIRHRGQPHVLYMGRDVTERKRAERALRDSEARYRAIFNTSADAIVLWDADIRFVDVNRAYTQLYGFEREDVIGTTLDPRLPPAAVAERIACMRAALAGEERVLETTTLRKNGEPFDVELRYLPITHLGAPHVLAIARDITERRRAEAMRQAQEQRYRSVFDGSADPMVLWNDQLVVVDVNAAFVRVRGYARESVVGRHWSQRVDARELADKVPLLEAALAGQASQVTDRVGRADGGQLDMELRYLPVRVGDERFVLSIGRDVSGQLQRERELAQSEARLRASEEQYRAIFNASVDALTLWDSRMRRVDINRAYERMYGWTRDDVIGKGYEQLPFGADYYAPRQALVRRALAGEVCSAELESIRKDGQRILTEIHAVPFTHRGEPHVLVIGRDITDRHAAESERLRLEEQLRQAQKMEAIGQLTGGIAHDFNNILTSVLGYIVLAQERALPHGDERLLRQLGQAQQAGERARDLVAQMLAFARRRAGRRHLMAPRPLLLETVDLLRPTLPSSVLLEVAAAEASLPAVDVDPVQMGQVLMNLLINARDAVGGAGRVHVDLRMNDGAWHCASCATAMTAGRWVEIRVGDNGSGIAPELLHRIFDPFFTTKPAGQGTGMGLAMVHGIVHDHGGHVAVESRPGEGTCFRVLLPAAAGRGAAADSLASAPTQRAPEGLRGRVMVVEDDPLVGPYLAEQLESWGLDVVLHADARAAWRELQDERAALQLLITDLTMPHLSGLELAQRVSAQRPGLPVLLISADLAAADDAVLATSGIRAALPKPIDAMALRRAITQALAAAA